MRLSTVDVWADAALRAARKDMESVSGPCSTLMLRPHNSAAWNPKRLARSGDMAVIFGGVDIESSIEKSHDAAFKALR